MSRLKWRIALVTIALILVAGMALMIALSVGAADPPRAPQLMLDTIAPAPINPLPAPPYTLEVSATNSGPPDSAWGFWIGADESDALVCLIDGQGYRSVAHGVERDWSQFIHLKPQTNGLYLNVEASQSATFRINGEIVWRGSIASTSENRWGIAADAAPQLNGLRVRVFAS